MRTWTEYEHERFYPSTRGFRSIESDGRIQRAAKIINILEDYFDIHPFPKQKHSAKFIQDAIQKGS